MSNTSLFRSFTFLVNVKLFQCISSDKLSFVDGYFVFKRREQASFITFLTILLPPNLELCIDVLDKTKKKSPLNWEEQSRIIKKAASFHFDTASGKLTL